MINAAILEAQNFQDEEFVYPCYRLLEEGYRVEVATPDGDTTTEKYGVSAPATAKIVDVDTAAFDRVILPDRFDLPDRLRPLAEVKACVAVTNQGKKRVAAICRGPWIAISADIMKDRRATGYLPIEDDLRYAGADYQAADLIVDDNLITAPHCRNDDEFMRAWHPGEPAQFFIRGANGCNDARDGCRRRGLSTRNRYVQGRRDQRTLRTAAHI